MQNVIKKIVNANEKNIVFYWQGKKEKKKNY